MDTRTPREWIASKVGPGLKALTPRERIASKAGSGLKALNRTAPSTHKKKTLNESGKSILHVRKRTGGRSRPVRRG